jgi:CRISPR locus-related DNA-binding protein
MNSITNSSRYDAEVIGVLGFDEKFLVRCVLRASSGYRVCRVVVLLPKPLDEYSMVRSEDAWGRVQRILADYAGITIEKIVANPTEFWSIVSTSRKIISEMLGRGKAIVCFSGGMRVLGTALVVAALTLPEAWEQSAIEVCIEHETHAGYTCFTPSQALAPLKLSQREYQVLKTLQEYGEAGPTLIEKETGLPKTTVWRILRKLEKNDIVQQTQKGRYKPKTQI